MGAAMGTAMALDRGSVETSRSMATTVAQLKWTRHFRLDLATADADHLDKPDRRGTKPASSRTASRRSCATARMYASWPWPVYANSTDTGRWPSSPSRPVHGRRLPHKATYSGGPPFSVRPPMSHCVRAVAFLRNAKPGDGKARFFRHPCAAAAPRSLPCSWQRFRRERANRQKCVQIATAGVFLMVALS